ncbi:MAG: hypothetical protein HZA46_16105 [Planctomycetales bacterium]|nr:hypothetical protein [Planctomycetales bacterium]
MILFCCGAWIPFYALLCLFPKKHPWMCSICGEQIGHVPAEVKQERRENETIRQQAERKRRQEEREASAAERERQARERKEIAQAKNERLREEREADAPERERRASERKEIAQAAASQAKELASAAGATILQQVKAAFIQANRALEWICGEDVALLRIAQAFSGLVGLTIAAAVLWFGISRLF